MACKNTPILSVTFELTKILLVGKRTMASLEKISASASAGKPLRALKSLRRRRPGKLTWNHLRQRSYTARASLFALPIQFHDAHQKLSSKNIAELIVDMRSPGSGFAFRFPATCFSLPVASSDSLFNGGEWLRCGGCNNRPRFARRRQRLHRRGASSRRKR